MQVFAKLVVPGLIFFIISQAPMVFLNKAWSAVSGLFFWLSELQAAEAIFQAFQVYPLFLFFFFLYVMAGVLLDLIDLNG